VLGWLIYQHNGLGNADFGEGMKYGMEVKGFGSGKERELDGREGRMHHRMTTDHETISFNSVLNHWRAKHFGIPTAAAFRFLGRRFDIYHRQHIWRIP
jgi:hypothetical protein